MLQQQQNSLVPIHQRPQSNLIQIGDQVYQLTQIHPQAIHPQPLPVQASSWIDDPRNILIMAGGILVVTVFVGWVVGRAALAPVPAQPQTVVIQPPQPEKKPYRRRECRAAGLFGWGQDCVEERGYE